MKDDDMLFWDDQRQDYVTAEEHPDCNPNDEWDWEEVPILDCWEVCDREDLEDYLNYCFNLQPAPRA